MKPPLTTLATGVKTSTTSTEELGKLEEIEIDKNVGAVRMAAMGCCWKPAWADVDNLKILSDAAAIAVADRVKTVSVTVRGAVPVLAPLVVMTIWVLAAVTVVELPASKDTGPALPATKLAVPMK